MGIAVTAKLRVVDALTRENFFKREKEHALYGSNKYLALLAVANISESLGLCIKSGRKLGFDDLHI